MKIKHKFTTDNTIQRAKPTGRQVGVISRNLTKVQQPDSVEEFIKFTSEYGCTWTPAVFDGKRNNKNWTSQSIFALDFDSGIEPLKVLRRFRKYDVEPNAYYHTFGHTPNKTKFRLVLFLDTLIKNRDLRDWIQKSLLMMFPESDQSTSDAARFFYGSDKRGIVLNEKEVPLNLLTSVLDSDKLKSGGRMRKIIDNSSYHDTSMENRVSSINNSNKIDTENHWTLDEKKEYRQHLLEQRNNGSVSWDKLERRVQIFHEFMYSKKRLKYAQLLGLAQNLVWLKGGAKLYRKRLYEFNENHQGSDPYPRDGRFELCRRFRKRNKDVRSCYFPMRLKNFSPYEKD